MGLFSERCACGNKVKKAADYCGVCGESRRGAWKTCQQCGASVGAHSNACWKCSADLTAQPNEKIYNDRWRRSAGDFAVRFSLRVPDGIVHHGIQVDAGTKAYLMSDGKHDDELGPGYHVESSFFERLTKLVKKGHQAEAVIVSVHPETVAFPIGGLHDSEQVPLGALVKIDMQLDNPEIFLERVMPGREQVGELDLRSLLTHEIQDAVRKRAAQYSIEDLLGDVSQREGMEATLATELQRILRPYGLKFSGVRLARVTGEAVEAIREKLGDKAVKIREYEIERELNALEKNHEFELLKTEREYQTLEAKLNHEYGLETAELELVRTRWERKEKHRDAMDILDEESEVELKRIANEAKKKRAEAGLLGADQDLIDLKTDRERERDRRDQEFAQEMQDSNMKRLREMESMKLDRQQREADIEIHKARGLDGVSKEAIIAATDDPGVRGNLIRLAEIQQGVNIVFPPGAGGVYSAPGIGDPRQAAAFGAYSQGNRAPFIAGHTQAQVTASSLGGSEDEKLKTVANQAMAAVGLLSITDSNGEAVSFGTGWMLGPRAMATNAHVAKDARQAIEQGYSCWASFGGVQGSRTAKVVQIVMHPKYGDPGPGAPGNKLAVPPFDVAILILDQDQPAFLPIASPEKLMHLTPGARVAYLGFPMEDMAGGGANSQNPAAIMKSGIVSQVTDWWLGQADPPQRYLIQHDLGVAGGASGSPLFDTDGQVVGIISAGNMAAGVDVTSGQMKRIPSGVLLNFAQRVDLLGELLMMGHDEQYM